MKKFLSPPTFADEDLTFQARLLHSILLTLLVVTLATLFAPLFIINPKLSVPVLYVLLVACLGISGGLFVLLQRGQVRLTSLLLVGAFWVIITFLAGSSGGLRSTGYLGYPVVVALAGLLLGGWATGLVTLASASAGYVMLITAAPEPAAYAASLAPLSAVWFSSTAYLIILAVLQYLVTQALWNALKRARASEARYRMLIEEAPDGICILDKNLQVLEFNPHAGEMLGYSPAEAIGQSVLKFVDPEDLAQRPLASAEDWRSGQAIRRERVLVHKAGRRLPVAGSLKALPDGRLQYVFQDITERKQAEAAAHQAEELYRRAIEVAGAVPYYEDYAANAYTFMGDGIQQLTGYSPAEMTPNKWGAISLAAYPAGENAGYSLTEAVHRARTGQVTLWKCDFLIRTASGEARWVADASIEILDGQGVSRSSLGILQDITERKRAEEKIHRLNADLEQRVRERGEALAREQRLNEITRIISSALDLETLFPNVVRLAVELVGAEAGSLALVAADGATMTYPYLFNIPQALTTPTTLRGIGLAWRIVETRAALTVDEYAAHPSAMPEWASSGFHAFVGVPIRVGEACLGALGLFSTDPAKRFDVRDVALLEAIGRQAGIAIQNANLFEAEQKRADLLTALHETGLDLSAELDLKLLLRTIMERAAHLVGAEMGGLYVMRADEQSLERVVNLPDDPTPTIVALGEGVVGRVAADGQAIIVPDYLEWPGRIPTIHNPPRAVLGVPIQWQDKPLGVLSVCDMRPNHFQPKDIDVVRLFTAQAAVAIKNAQLFAAEQQRVKLLTAIHETGLDLSAELDLQTLLQTIMERAVYLVDAPWGSLYLMQVDGETLTRAAAFPQDTDSLSVPLGEGLVGQVAANRQPLLLADYLNWPNRIPDWPDPPRSVIGTPIQWQGEPLGVLTVSDPQPNRFQDNDVDTVQLFAAQAAVAIKNAQLFAAARRQLEELTILHAAALSAANATNEDDLITRMTNIIGETLHPDVYGVTLVDWPTGILHPHPSQRGLDADYAPPTIPITQGIAGQAIRTRQAIRVADVTQQPDYVAVAPAIRSELCVPLKVSELVIGVLNIESTRVNAFSESDERLLVTMAGQLATAIARLRLTEELEDRVRQRTEELSAANAALAKAARLKDEFLASMSHELRTPLTGILAFAQALQKQVYGPLTDKQLKSLQSIEDSGKHLLELINDILDLSKIEAGKFELEPSPIVVEDLCQAALRLVKQMAQTKQQTIAYSLRPLDLELVADSRRLKQMLVNLLSNAVKFTPAGGQLGLEVEADERLNSVRFSVWDKGIGIDPADLTRLFQPFMQLDSRLAREYAGTGLGLALVRRMTELHGGSVTVESRPGEGSRFVITLPWRRPPEVSHRKVEALSAYPALRHALTIEDSPIAAEQITRYLNELGIANVVVPRAAGVVAKAAELLPSVLLLDLFLPDQSGWDLLGELKADARTKDIPVIIISVLDDRARGKLLGAADYLVKPIALADLQTALRRVANPVTVTHPALVIPVATPSATHARLLLAEDNEVNISVLTDYLEAEDYQVSVARNGSEAVQLARDLKPALILMDIQMPGMDGLEATRRIRLEPGLARIPIVALTALAMPGDRERCLAAGATEYLTKPVNLEELSNLISKLLNP